MSGGTRSAILRTGSLRLDAKNTRIPADRRSDDQRGLLHELLEHEDVKGLAASIAKLGLFPNERLVVTHAGTRYVVLEGNRRLAAIKLLLNPELAPTDPLVRYFRRLSGKMDLSEIGRLEVAIVPNRVSAAPIIAALHTRESKRRWSSLQQARFYRELVDEGQSPAEIAEELGVALGQVNSYLRTEKLYRIALTLNYPEAVRRRLEDSKFPLTTLERFLESKNGRALLGIELDDKTGFKGVVHVGRFKAVLARVAEHVATKAGLTREINDEPGFRAYASNLEPTIPATTKRGSFSSDSLLAGGVTEPPPDTDTSSENRGKKPSKTSSSVVPRGFTCRSKHERVRSIFQELKAMRIVDQRNSTGVMLRVLLDIALWAFLRESGNEQSAVNHFDANRKRRIHNPDWTPALRDLISYCVEKRIFPGMTADGYRAIRSLASKDGAYFITIDGFNSFTHNQYVTPTEGDLRALWQRAEPMLEIILN